MNIVNLTPHDINIVDKRGGKVADFKGSGIDGSARVSTDTKQIGDINGVPLFDVVFGDVTGLPDAIDGTMFIVSGMVKSARPDRKDLLIVANTVRDDKNRIIGALGFSK